MNAYWLGQHAEHVMRWSEQLQRQRAAGRHCRTSRAVQLGQLLRRGDTIAYHWLKDFIKRERS